jgi:hypothetical protein
MSMILDGTNGVTFNDTSLQGAAASPYVLKNRIINGDMRIDQRNAGASVTPTTDQTYTVDRWEVLISQASKISVQQQTSVVPTGFTNAVKITSLASTSLGAGDYFCYAQIIEGYNIDDLAWGTANAKTVTLSFRVYSSLTGTFGGNISNGSQSRAYPFTYSIPTANTWTTISVTIAGDTSGTWLTTNGRGIWLQMGLGVGTTYSGTAGAWVGSALLGATGAVSVVGTNGATFYITGVQLEQNTSATPFERRLYDKELISCQRYYEVLKTYDGGAGASLFGFSSSSASAQVFGNFQVTKRTTPTFTSAAAANYTIYLGTAGTQTPSAVTLDNANANVYAIGFGATALSLNIGLKVYMSGSGYYAFSAEL